MRTVRAELVEALSFFFKKNSPSTSLRANGRRGDPDLTQIALALRQHFFHPLLRLPRPHGGIEAVAPEQLRMAPLLGDLPFIGNLFRSRNVTTDDKELLIFVTPTILPERVSNASVGGGAVPTGNGGALPLPGVTP